MFSESLQLNILVLFLLNFGFFLTFLFHIKRFYHKTGGKKLFISQKKTLSI